MARNFVVNSDELRVIECTLISIMAGLAMVAAASSWHSLWHGPTQATMNAVLLVLFPAGLFVPFATLLALRRLRASRKLNDDIVRNIWATCVLIMPVPRILIAMCLPVDELGSTFNAFYSRVTVEILQIGLMLAGMLHAVVLHPHSCSYKLRLAFLNYAQEFILLVVGITRLRGDGVGSVEERTAMESWIYFSAYSRLFLFTNFPKIVPFSIGF